MRFILLFVLLCYTAALPAQDRETLRRNLQTASAPFERLSEVFRSSVEFANPIIVHIEATQIKSVNPGRSGRMVKMQVEESGSGIIVDIADKQIILTNRHVVEGIELDSIKVQTYDRRLLTPVRILTNEDFDLAVMEVAEKMPYSADLGDSDRVQVGDIVLAVGSPFGLDRSVSMGIIGAVNRRNIPATNGITPKIGFFQTDAAINPGSSGGPLLNLRGEIIGLVTAIATQGGGDDGVAFVLPIKLILRIAEQLVRNGTAVKPHIGLGFDPEFNAEKRKKLGIDRQIGARINRVVPETPSAQIGLRVGDVILSFNGTEVEDDTHIVHLVALTEINKPVKITINREGNNMDLSITPSVQISR
ncbi:MAG: trypsin-like peptidase domain-containing protein [Planctomycetaceae bacterium]|jgi:serine protease Do|nr:trypsin-like peptidase domain-containing protein [Planctomycetaceae bacterium]